MKPEGKYLRTIPHIDQVAYEIPLQFSILESPWALQKEQQDSDLHDHAWKPLGRKGRVLGMHYASSLYMGSE